MRHTFPKESSAAFAETVGHSADFGAWSQFDIFGVLSLALNSKSSLGRGNLITATNQTQHTSCGAHEYCEYCECDDEWREAYI